MVSGAAAAARPVAPAPAGGAISTLAAAKFGASESGELDSQPVGQVADRARLAPKLGQEFRIITSNSHIQIHENGSLIIRELELADSSRYICQAFNGINPSLSEVIDLQVLSECPLYPIQLT